VFPNPIILDAQISFYTESLSQCKIEIFNITGSLIKTMQPDTSLGYNQMQITKEGLSAGIYYLKVTTDTKNFDAVQLIVN